MLGCRTIRSVAGVCTCFWNSTDHYRSHKSLSPLFIARCIEMVYISQSIVSRTLSDVEMLHILDRGFCNHLCRSLDIILCITSSFLSVFWHMLRVLEPEEFGIHISALFLLIVSIHMPYAILDGYVT
jgi:hypothetical protein